MRAAFRIEEESSARILDQLDYFQVLELEPDATPAQIKAAYHRKSRVFHPDRFLQVAGAELRAQILAIHKRITEAYTVLREEERRRAYAAAVTGPERERHLRWTEREGEAPGPEEVGTTAKGRQRCGGALLELEAGRLDEGARNLKMALVCGPGSPHYARKAEEVAALRKPSLQAGSRSST